MKLDLSSKKEIVVGLIVSIILCSVILVPADIKLNATLLYRNTFYGLNQSTLGPNINASDDEIPNKQRLTVVCMIFTQPENWETRAKAVHNTWLKRCPIPLMFYSKSAVPNPNHPIVHSPLAVGLDVPEGRNHLTGKTMSALRYSLQIYGHVADWFLKADDDTYFIWENLERFLKQQNSKDALYIGRKIQTHLPHGYASGGAGYVLSRPAVSLIVKNATKYPQQCPQDGSIEDLDIGRCLQNFGIYPTNTVDLRHRQRFHTLNPVRFLDGDSEHAKFFYLNWGNNVTFGNVDRRLTDHILAPDAISFHYVSPGHMYMYEFLLYRIVRPQLNSNLSSEIN